MARPKKADSAKTKYTAAEEQQQEVRNQGGFSQYLRFGESYTSLILGIIVVIIATALLLSFVNNRNVKDTPPISEQVQNIAISKQPLQITPKNPEGTAKTEPTKAPEKIAKQEPTKAPTKAPTQTPTKEPTKTPTQVVTKAPTAPTKVQKSEPTKVATANPTTAPSKAQDRNIPANAKEWTVQKNETLWDIAEQHYSSGYNWVDIARVNKLSNPNDIHAGNKLVLPQVAKKTPTIENTQKMAESSIDQKNTTKIQGDSYKVIAGDNLWTIAERAYGDGFKSSEIAKANNIKNPNIIEKGITLKLPRK